MREDKNWYIVYTKPKVEKRVSEILEKRHIPTYFPESSRVQYVLGRKRVVRIPLMPSLLFVFSSEQDFEKVISTDGVAGVLYKFNKPATIRSKELVVMQRFLAEHDDVSIEKIPLGYIGDNSTDKASSQKEALFSTEYEADKIFLPSIGYCLCTKPEVVLLNNVA